jgi:predicted nucleotidyltransferase
LNEKVGMNEVEQKVAGKFKSLLSGKVSVWKIILFGSRARGDADFDSDMDMLVVVSGNLDRAAREIISVCAWEAGFEYGIVVVPVIYTRDEWENGPERRSLLSIAVNMEGIPL